MSKYNKKTGGSKSPYYTEYPYVTGSGLTDSLVLGHEVLVIVYYQIPHSNPDLFLWTDSVK